MSKLSKVVTALDELERKYGNNWDVDAPTSDPDMKTILEFRDTQAMPPACHIVVAPESGKWVKSFANNRLAAAFIGTSQSAIGHHTNYYPGPIKGYYIFKATEFAQNINEENHLQKLIAKRQKREEARKNEITAKEIEKNGNGKGTKRKD